MSEKQPTIVDVAREASVSTATVSRAMTGGSISAATREKVEAAMKRLRYRPGAARSGQKKGGDRCIAAVLSSQTSPYYASMCEGATAEAARSGYRLLVLSYPEGTGCETVANDLLELKPAGALLAGFAVESSFNQDLTRSCLQRIQQAMPLVAIGPPIEGIECARLTSDPSQCVRKAMAHLHMLGHRRIAFVGGDRSARFSIIRENAYYEEAERLGCAQDPTYVMLTGCNTQAGELGAGILLGNHQPKDYPTAIFAVNDEAAIGALYVAKRMGIKVPEQLSICGFTNTLSAMACDPQLTSVEQDGRQVGKEAADILIGLVEGKYDPAHAVKRIVKTKLVIRETTR